MADLEKVLNGLETCVNGECAKCPYGGTCSDAEDFVALARDALELLKAQEAVIPVLVYEGANKQRNNYKCPKCHTHLCYGQRYCEWCGRKVAWE